MKKIVFTLAFALFAVLAVNAQVSTSNKATEADKQAAEKARMEKEKAEKEQAEAQKNNPNAPVITFDKTTHDYGTIEQNGDGNCEFKFTNDGKEPLILSNVRSSCGCTVPEWPRQPILPGQSDAIKVHYDTKRVGMISKTITVYSNAKEATVVLNIKGNVLAAAANQMPEKKMDKEGSPVNK